MQITNGTTSLSDERKYLDACLEASKNIKDSAFKSDPRYTWVLENILGQHGYELYSYIYKNYPNLLPYIEYVGKINDQYGKPNKYLSLEYSRDNNIVKKVDISPTTIRYLKVLGDLLRYFPYVMNGPNSSIVEIGGGYGGQKLIIDLYRVESFPLYNPISYTMIDLYEPIQLQKAYHEIHKIGEMTQKVNYWVYPDNKEQIECGGPYDLCISNYAFSECYKEVQDLYIEKVLLKSTMGYITLNDIKEEGKRYDFYSYNDLLKIIPGSRLVDETPISANGNKVLIWGDKR